MMKFFVSFLMVCMGIMSNGYGYWPKGRRYVDILPTVSIVAIRIGMIIILLIVGILLAMEIYTNKKYHMHINKKIFLLSTCICVVIVICTFIFVCIRGLELVSIGYPWETPSTITRVFDFTEW